MSENLSPISIVQQLLKRGLSYFTSRLLAGLFGLDIGQVYRLVPRLKESDLILEGEAEGYRFYAQEASEFAEASARAVAESLLGFPYLPSSDA